MKKIEIFNIVQNKEDEHVITCGNYLVSSKKFKNEKAAENYVKSKPYEIIINTIFAALKMKEDEIKQKNNAETKTDA